MGVKVDEHLRHKGATPSPPVGIVVKHPTGWLDWAMVLGSF